MGNERKVQNKGANGRSRRRVCPVAGEIALYASAVDSKLHMVNSGGTDLQIVLAAVIVDGVLFLFPEWSDGGPRICSHIPC
jgi:hypothetical protein